MKFFIQTTVQYLTAIAAASSVILGMIVPGVLVGTSQNCAT